MRSKCSNLKHTDVGVTPRRLLSGACYTRCAQIIY